MRLVINRPDGVVGVDGNFLRLDLSKLPSEIRAVQWTGITGHIEKYDCSNESLKDISVFMYLVIEHQKKAQEKTVLETAEQRVMQEYIYQVDEINSRFNEIDVMTISPILKVKLPALTLSEKKYGSKVIGLNIDYLMGDKTGSGVAGLLAIKNLSKKLKALTIPLFAELQPKGIDKEQFSVFFEKLGAKVFRHPHANYMYMENSNG